VSNFSEQLKVAMGAADLTQAEMSAATSFSQSTILDALPASLHYELIVARLADELPEKYRDAVTILAQGGIVREQSANLAQRPVANDLRAALDHLAAEAIQEHSVRELVIALARALGAKE
jgi:hypothetical protein